MKKIEYAKYVITFIVTAGLFATIFYVSKVVSDDKLNYIKNEQDELSINLLSSEIQFSLLKEGGCTVTGTSFLAHDIQQLGQRLNFMEGQLGADNVDVVSLKKYYSLLQIKDYILTKELASRCKVKPITIIYFYKDNCDECVKQGYVLDQFSEKYPTARVYSFDSNIKLAAIKTLENMNIVSETKPAIVVDGITYSGFKTLEDIEKILDSELKLLNTSTTSSTSTTR